MYDLMLKLLIWPKTITYNKTFHYRCTHIKDNGQQCGHTVNTWAWEEYGDRICTHHSFMISRRKAIQAILVQEEAPW